MTTPPLTNWQLNDQCTHGHASHGMYPPSGCATWRHLQASSQEGLMAHCPQLVKHMISLGIIAVYFLNMSSFYHDVAYRIVSYQLLYTTIVILKVQWTRRAKRCFLISYRLSWHPGKPALFGRNRFLSKTKPTISPRRKRHGYLHQPTLTAGWLDSSH